MKKLGIAAVVAGGLGAVVMGLASPVYAAPHGNGGAQPIPQVQAPGWGTPRPSDDAVKRLDIRAGYLVLS